MHRRLLRVAMSALQHRFQVPRRIFSNAALAINAKRVVYLQGG